MLDYDKTEFSRFALHHYVFCYHCLLIYIIDMVPVSVYLAYHYCYPLTFQHCVTDRYEEKNESISSLLFSDVVEDISPLLCLR